MNKAPCTMGILVALGFLLAGEMAFAASYPAKPVRIIVPYGAGGGVDIQARLLAPLFHEWTSKPFIVENRSGASGLIGAEIAARSVADGYTILFSTATLTINKTLYGSRMKIDPVKDLAPISWIASTPLVLVVHPSVPAKSVKELVGLAKRKPAFLNSGIVSGSVMQLSAEMLKQKAGIDAVLVPYKSGVPAITALISGEIDYLFPTAPVASVAIKSRRAKGLAVTAAKKSSAFPNLPTMNTFYPGFESENWYAMWFPAKTPGDIVAKMNQLIVKALQVAKVREFMIKRGLEPVGSTPEELGDQVKRDITRYAEVIRKGNITLK